MLDRFSLKLESWRGGTVDTVDSGWWEEETLIRSDYTVQTVETGPLLLESKISNV